ncbi:FUSC family membrane protein [Cytophagales bacterium LB-30]|uniref:FUSC family membrane protein n=1 Tax=Shiella aurantiaca TaxID=3058365 RepID=A0ABT8F1U0_9BACT|nr:FUSC family membrane protein [Shiella aurantiaca]MDN4164001.1 FUSC family membrane protein [Shiella aurantiaca]
MDSRSFRYFLRSQYVADGLRISLGVLLPSLLFFYQGKISLGVAASLGALCVGLTDHPGPIAHKRNAMLLTSFLLLLVSWLTALLNAYLIPTTLWLAVLCFVFGIITVYGMRAGIIGTATLLIAILALDQEGTWQEITEYAFYIFAGGIWYTMLSLVFYQFFPFRAAQQALGDSIKEVAHFLRLKAQFYGINPVEESHYQAIIDQQVKVHHGHDQVREMLFKTRKIVKDTSPQGRQLVLTFIELVDLFEQTMASHFDYRLIRKQWNEARILPIFEQIIGQMAHELDQLAISLHDQSPVLKPRNFEPRLAFLKKRIDALESQGHNTLLLKKILVNLRNIGERILQMYAYQQADLPISSIDASKGLELSKFVQHESHSWESLRSHISFRSAYFRYAIRLALVVSITYLLMQLFHTGTHSYWILLTLVVVLKPGFTLTRQRNYERLVGTILGGLMGIVILYLIPDQTSRFFILVALMIAAYSFLRYKYIWSVFFLTPFVLLAFSFFSEGNELLLAGERIMDTLIGSVIAAGASLWLFPVWEYKVIRGHAVKATEASCTYFSSIISRNYKNNGLQAYKLARKSNFVAQSLLAGSFQRMLSEPQSKQKHADVFYQIVVIHHTLSSYLATLSYQSASESQFRFSEHQVRMIRRIHSHFQEMLPPELRVKGDIFSSLQAYTATEENAFLTETLELLEQTAASLKRQLLQLPLHSQNTP